MNSKRWHIYVSSNTCMYYLVQHAWQVIENQPKSESKNITKHAPTAIRMIYSFRPTSINNSLQLYHYINIE